MEFESFINCIDRLSCTQRFSQEHLHKRENVLEHTAMVCFVADYIYTKTTKLKGDRFTQSRAMVLVKALYHDIDESKTGDLPMPLKYSDGKFRIDLMKIESKMVKKIQMETGILDLHQTWTNSKIETEGEIVSIADSFCALYKFHNESCTRGNKNILKLMDFDSFDKLKLKIKRLGGIPIFESYCEKIFKEMMELKNEN